MEDHESYDRDDLIRLLMKDQAVLTDISPNFIEVMLIQEERMIHAYLRDGFTFRDWEKFRPYMEEDGVGYFRQALLAAEYARTHSMSANQTIGVIHRLADEIENRGYDFDRYCQIVGCDTVLSMIDEQVNQGECFGMPLIHSDQLGPLIKDTENPGWIEKEMEMIKRDPVIRHLFAKSNKKELPLLIYRVLRCESESRKLTESLGERLGKSPTGAKSI